MDRRAFIRSAMFYTVASATGGLAGCHAGGNDGDGDGGGGNPPPPANTAFPQGVASGDPKESSIVFWTRYPGTGAAGPRAIRLELSLSDTFSSIVASVGLSALPAWDYTVRAKVTGLSPGTPYYYRFVAGANTSPVGMARTAPAASSTPQSLRFAWLSCQDWSYNHWGAFTLLAQEQLDFVVHVGDYIYEAVDTSFHRGQAEPAHGYITLPNGVPNPGSTAGIHATSVEDYRTLYRTYRGDTRLQEVHRRFPMIGVWDDHEFSDDCWQDHQTYDNSNTRETQRRRNANQAWAEYMPVDFGDVSFDLSNPAYDNIRLYRDFRFGTLLHLVMTDERLYRDDHVVAESLVAEMQGHDPVHGDDYIGARSLVIRDVLLGAERADTIALGHVPSILGQTQATWWKNTLRASTARWKVWGNEVTLNRMWLDLRGKVPAPYDQLYVLNADVWDGYPSARAELMSYLKAQNIRNVVAVSGDLHAFQCGVVRDNPDPSVGTPVMVDFVGAGVSSLSYYHEILQELGKLGSSALTDLAAIPRALDRLLLDHNPDLVYGDHDAQGYAVATVTADSFVVDYNKVKPLNDNGTAPSNPLDKRTRITLGFGSTSPVVVG
ncbi:alkaline phosphatase D family protein [Massilia agilis]|uniref:Alkaline phosphatase D family protein n=1 Tax=Massilia agilis TaxID=1811226 RepID=A0ABT2DAS8_9BURK|nr:alkaline phosphatase D family protein [Massilia agilis]MCS0808419.1 alkaline phosphatase D family protein [Massilia agilis]